MPQPEKYIILFDGVCNFCNASINFVIDRDGQDVFQFASLQSDFGQKLLQKFGRQTQDFDSILLVQGDTLLEKSDAVLHIACYLNSPWHWLRVFKVLPKGLRNFCYDIVAKNRYAIFGKTESCRIPTPAYRAKFIEF